MPLVSMRELLDHAAINGYGIPAFNVNNLEQVQAVMAAADEVGAPVILQASAGARKYAGEPFIKHLIQAAVEAFPHIPLVMHQDHGTSPKVCQGAIDLGFGSVMMDGSLMEDGKTPSSFDYNVDVTRKVVDMAHKVGVTVEGELGCLGNLETGDAGEEDGIGAEGKLDDKDIEIEVAQLSAHVEMIAPPGMEELTQQIQGMFANMGNGQKKSRKLKISEARKLITDEEAAKFVNEEDTKRDALRNVEQNGIVFIDEIDKVTARGETSGSDVSRAGVQRDLLPLVEGTTVSTKYGMVKTDHILFIASGAFHLSKPSDLVPELQGRFPIRVELSALSVDDFVEILTNTDACLTRQYQALLATEGTELAFTDAGIRRMAEIAWQVNEKMENIGARRLHTVMEKLLEELSFAARSEQVAIDDAYVDSKLASLAQREDLARYVL